MTALAAMLGLAFSCQGQEAESRSREAAHVRQVAEWLEFQRKPRGGYGPPGARRGDPLWTERVLRCRELLGLEPDPALAKSLDLPAFLPDLGVRERLADHALRRRLGQKQPESPPTPFTLPPLTSWIGSRPLDELELGLRWRLLVGGPLKPGEAGLLRAYLGVWRAPDGGWAWPASLDEAFAAVREQRDLTSLPAGGPRPSTLGAIAAAIASFELAGLPVPEPAKAVKRIRALRVPGQGYRSGSPASVEADLWSTYHALRALESLAAVPTDREGLASWLEGHRHVTGAYAHAEDEPASLEATWLVLEAQALHGLGRAEAPSIPWRGGLPPADHPEGLRLFEALVEIGPDYHLSMALAETIGADLVLLKEFPDWPERPRFSPEAGNPWSPILGAHALEEHLRAWGVAGVGYVTHCSDMLFPPGARLTPRTQHVGFEEIAKTWTTDRAAGARVFSCSHGHRELLAPAYDRSLQTGVGYDALMVGWAFAPRGNVIARHPWLHRYVGRLPVLGNHDAHGDPFHWFHRGLRSRTFFFAETSDFLGGFQAALAANRVVVMTGRGEDRVFFGHPHWVKELEKREGEIRWPATAVRDDWLPPPLALPVHHGTQDLLPELREGRGIVVRSAGLLGDDSMPHEVRLTVDGQDVPLRLAAPGGARRPVLWASVSHLDPASPTPACRHEVVITGPGGTWKQTLRFGAPRRRRDEATGRITGWKKPPTRLDFESVEELPFVRTPVAPGDFAGTVRIRARRADFFVDRPRGESVKLVVTMRGGKQAGLLEWFVNGVPVGLRKSVDVADHVSFEVPPRALIEGAQRISLRTRLSGWLPSFPLPASDLEIDSLALVPGSEGR